MRHLTIWDKTRLTLAEGVMALAGVLSKLAMALTHWVERDFYAGDYRREG